MTENITAGNMTTPSSVQPPSSDSPSLALFQSTPAEKLATWHLNGQNWRGPLSLHSYVRREEVLGFVTRGGRMSSWVLVDSSIPVSKHRKILASCETYRKRALIARQGRQVEEIVSHGIGSVFCDPQLRGHGYAGRMMKELGQKLDTWQQEYGKKTDFSVLFSDIGKNFYAKQGWHPFASSHIELSPLVTYTQDPYSDHLPTAKALHTSDLSKLCDIDEALLKSRMERLSLHSSKIQVALIADLQTYEWHHARENFVAHELSGRVPDVKGAMVEAGEGKRVWCIWTRTYGDSEAENVLHILRVVIEGETEPSGWDGGIHDQLVDMSNLSREHVLATASVLSRARHEAACWNMKHVQIWNPSPFCLLAAQQIEPSTQIIDREQESIACLRWHDAVGDQMVWVANEKFGWC